MATTNRGRKGRKPASKAASKSTKPVTAADLNPAVSGMIVELVTAHPGTAKDLARKAVVYSMIHSKEAQVASEIAVKMVELEVEGFVKLEKGKAKLKVGEILRILQNEACIGRKGVDYRGRLVWQYVALTRED